MTPIKTVSVGCNVQEFFLHDWIIYQEFMFHNHCHLLQCLSATLVSVVVTHYGWQIFWYMGWDIYGIYIYVIYVSGMYLLSLFQGKCDDRKHSV